MAEAKWTNRLGKSARFFGLAAIAVAFIGLTLARYDVIPKLTGFMAFLGSGLIAALALACAIIALLMGLNSKPVSNRPALTGLIIGGALFGFLASRALGGGDIPPLHDISTDLENPPAYAALELRADNLAGVGTIENWRAMHSSAYPDIKPVIIAKPVADVVADIDNLARARGWEIALSDPAAGTVEATASVSYIRFQDDVSLRVTPLAGGASSQVDMRSTSQVGVGDLGVNAERVQAFLNDLAQ